MSELGGCMPLSIKPPSNSLRLPRFSLASYHVELNQNLWKFYYYRACPDSLVQWIRNIMTILNIWHSHEYLGLQSCWLSYDQPLISQNCLRYPAVTCSICLQTTEVKLTGLQFAPVDRFNENNCSQSSNIQHIMAYCWSNIRWFSLFDQVTSVRD
jgi:hypothetical protein